MFEQIIKSFEYLPRQENETSRDITVRMNENGAEFRLGLFIGEWYFSTYAVSNDELENAKFDASDYALKQVCKRIELGLTNTRKGRAKWTTAI